MSQEHGDANVGRIMRQRTEAKMKLTRLQTEAKELGKKFDELGKNLQKLSEVKAESAKPQSKEEQNLSKFLEHIEPETAGIESYESHLSKDTYAAIGKLKGGILEAAKVLAGLNEQVKSFE